MTTTYKKQWQVEVFHKSLKSNASMAKSPTRTVRSQSSHVFMAIYATFKLECLSIANKLNPFRALSKATHQRIARRLCPASAVQGRCATSVINSR